MAGAERRARQWGMQWFWNFLTTPPKDFREWLLILAAVAGWMQPYWRKTLRRWVGDAEMRERWRFDVMFRYENDPRLLCRLFATGDVKDVRLESIEIVSPDGWHIAKVADMSVYQGRIVCKVTEPSSRSIAVKIEPDAFQTQWKPGFSNGEPAYWFFVSPCTMTSDGASGGCHGFDPSRLSMTIAIVPTLCAILDNRRRSFFRLRSQPIEDAKLIPSKAP